MADESSLSESVTLSYLELSILAHDLNAISDELGTFVSEIDAALKKLNLGISVWVRVGGWHDPQTLDYFSETIGYAKVNGKWGIALRTQAGNENDPDQTTTEEWLFNEGPRKLRLAAVDKIPDLLKTLSRETQSTTEKIKAKLDAAKEVADAVKKAASKPIASPTPPKVSNRSLGVQK